MFEAKSEQALIFMDECATYASKIVAKIDAPLLVGSPMEAAVASLLGKLHDVARRMLFAWVIARRSAESDDRSVSDVGEDEEDSLMFSSYEKLFRLPFELFFDRLPLELSLGAFQPLFVNIGMLLSEASLRCTQFRYSAVALSLLLSLYSKDRVTFGILFEGTFVSEMAGKLWDHLIPESLESHLEVTQYIHRLCDAFGSDVVENCIVKRLSVSSSLSVSDDVQDNTTRLRALQQFQIYFKYAGVLEPAHCYFPRATCLMLNTLRDNDPVVHCLGYNWIRMAMPSLNRLMDPLLANLASEAILRAQHSPCFGEHQIRMYRYRRMFDIQLATYALQTILSIAKWTTSAFWSTLRTTTASAGLVQAIETLDFRPLSAGCLSCVLLHCRH